MAPDRYELRTDARVHELFETDVAGRLGLITAAAYALRLGIDRIAERITALGTLARDGLAALPGVCLHDLGREHGGIVTFTVAGRTPAEVRAELWSRQVTVAVSPASTSTLDLPARGLVDGVVRASPHYFVTEDEVRRFVDEVGKLSG